LSEAAERVARDQDLTAPLPAPTHDGWDASPRASTRCWRRWPRARPATAPRDRRQPRAAHPLTSLRTTIELLRRADRSPTRPSPRSDGSTTTPSTSWAS
jgi:hypothetical protein